VLLAFGGTCVVASWRVRPENLAAKRLVVDLSGGIVLPLLCFAYDPILRGWTPKGRAAVYLAVGFQILLLAAWKLVGPATRRHAGFFAGAFSVGVILAALIGTFLLPFSMIGLLIGIGVLGFTPFLTAWVLARNVGQAFRQALPPSHKRPDSWPLVAGLLTAIGVPGLIYLVAGDVIGGLLERLPTPAFGPFFGPFS